MRTLAGPALGSLLLLNIAAAGTPEPVPVFQWVDVFAGDPEDEPGLTLDGDDNLWVVGCFDDTIDVDPGPGVVTLTSAGQSDAFLLKLNPSGEFLWAGQIGGPERDCLHRVAVDESGHVHAAGIFRSTADLDPGPGVFELTAVSSDAFIVKVAPSGAFVWARQMEGDGSAIHRDIAVDADKVYTIGKFTGTADFDPGPGVFELTVQGFNQFVWALDSAGDFAWAFAIAPASASTSPEGIAVRNGVVHVTGDFSGDVDFDPGPGTAILEGGCFDVFVMALTTEAELLWARATETEPCGGDVPFGAKPKDVAVGPGGDVYTVGLYSWKTDFDPGPGQSLLDSGLSDVRQGFVWKLDADGNFVWVRELKSHDPFSSERDVTAAATNDSGAIHVAGSFTGTMDFDPSTAENELTADIRDAFLVKLAADGTFRWAGALSGGITRAWDLDVSDTAVHACGLFEGEVDFDPGPRQVIRASDEVEEDFYVVTLNPLADDVPALHTVGAIGLAALLLAATTLALARRRQRRG
jgi:uncharacterized protein (DUF2249 family)